MIQLVVSFFLEGEDRKRGVLSSSKGEKRLGGAANERSVKLIDQHRQRYECI